VIASNLEVDGVLALSFLDMIELRFVDAFRSAGVSWATIRLASERACELVGHDHPFSTNRFKTDGRSILAEVGSESKDQALLNMVSQQFTVRKLILPYLYKGLDFSREDVAIRWWPLQNKTILIDPNRSFGQPIVSKAGVPTAILAQAYRIEKSIERVAAWYEVDRRSVRAAVEFENSLAA
jgi:uncharacterized protein (DUF433 family)